MRRAEPEPDQVSRQGILIHVCQPSKPPGQVLNSEAPCRYMRKPHHTGSISVAMLGQAGLPDRFYTIALAPVQSFIAHGHTAGLKCHPCKILRLEPCDRSTNSAASSDECSSCAGAGSIAPAADCPCQWLPVWPLKPGLPSSGAPAAS
jgi:hypothetical protein